MRVCHNRQLTIPFARTFSYFNSYFVSIVRLWNSLPAEVVCCDNVGAFKIAIKDFFFFVTLFYAFILQSLCTSFTLLGLITDIYHHVSVIAHIQIIGASLSEPYIISQTVILFLCLYVCSHSVYMCVLINLTQICIIPLVQSTSTYNSAIADYECVRYW